MEVYELQISHPGHFIPDLRTIVVHSVASLGLEEEKNNYACCVSDISLVLQPVAIPT